jgi:hypothetical protein
MKHYFLLLSVYLKEKIKIHIIYRLKTSSRKGMFIVRRRGQVTKFTLDTTFPRRNEETASQTTKPDRMTHTRRKT